MLFTEFLIDRKFVQPSQLVQALVIQSQTQPSPAEVAFRNGHMSAEEILKVYHALCGNDANFVVTARQLGYLDAKKVSEIENHLRKLRRPLGAILIDLGFTDTDRFVKAADDYLATLNSSTKDLELSNMVLPHPVRENRSGGGGNFQTQQRVVQEYPIEKTPEEASHSAMQEAYLEGYTETQRDELKNLFTFMGTWERFEGDDQRAIFDFVKKRIHILLGSARFAELPQSEQLFLALEKCMDAIELLNSNGAYSNKFTEFKDLASRALNLTWDLRDALKNTASEATVSISCRSEIDKVLESSKEFSRF